MLYWRYDFITSMNSFLRVGSVVRIVFFELLTAVCFASALTYIIKIFGPFGCPSEININWFLLAFIIISALGMYHMMNDILRPHFDKDGFQGIIRAGNWIITDPFLKKIEYTFASTHPSYIFIDAASVIFSGMVFWVYNHNPATQGCEYTYAYLFGHLLFAFSLLFPILRLISWYGLKRQIPSELTKDAWKPIVYFWIMIGIMILVGVSGSRIF